MAGIAGAFLAGAQDMVSDMLDKIAYRGKAGREMLALDEMTVGMVYPQSQAGVAKQLAQEHTLLDQAGDEHYVQVRMVQGHPLFSRDSLGVAPLYYGFNNDGVLFFSSEIKALVGICQNPVELPPGSQFNGSKVEKYYHLIQYPPFEDSLEVLTDGLYKRLSSAVERRIGGDVMGSWLSGGLDSSTLAALARPHLRTLHSFAAGLSGAPDIQFAREVASFIQSQHHEIVLDLNTMLEVLPTVIYHLESFDALLVRSSITNFMVAKMASDYVSEVFSGEGGDELLGGYQYLKDLDQDMLAAELIDITNRLHNTALQRVDRSAAAHSTVAHVPFLDPEVVEFAHRIPVRYKIHDGIEKWILRHALKDKLPERVLNRTKAKFWEGAGVNNLLSQHAEKTISSADFTQERQLPNGWILDSKEELMYYRIFKEYYGQFQDLTWMGRTKK